MKKLTGLFSGALMLAAVIASASLAAADAPQVKITSWESVGDGGTATVSQLAEVCGVVTGATQNPILLEVVPDYNTKNPGDYHTFAGTTGDFCMIVRTFAGTVQVTVMNSTPAAKATARLR